MITVTVPYGTNLSYLVAVFMTGGGDVYVRGFLQESGVTHNDFSNVVCYLVHMDDWSLPDKYYYVAVSHGPAQCVYF